MSIEVKVPQLPESVEDATIAAWHKEKGDRVSRDENLVDLETDKVVLEVPAPADGILGEIMHGEGDTVTAGEVLATLEEGAGAGDGSTEDVGSGSASDSGAEKSGSEANSSETKADDNARAKAEDRQNRETESSAGGTDNGAAGGDSGPLSPAVRRLVQEHELDPAKIPGTGKAGRLTKADVLAYLEGGDSSEQAGDEPQPAEAAGAPPGRPAAPAPRRQGSAGESGGISPDADITPGGKRQEQRVPMTRLRRRIAERLVEAQQTAAILTTWNEVDLGAVGELRQRYKQPFEKEYGARLGYMSFFVKAAVEALKRFPVINASVDGTDVVYHGYFDIGIAVSAPRGLVVPILRDADQMSFAEVEKSIIDFAERARDGSLTMDDLTGGTFSITNGGVFGSLMSSPILNPPQSAILGMHKIQQRPMVVDDEIVARPMMYLALSYDHRLVDGKDAVQFLVAIKELLEDPARLMLQI